MHNDVYERQCLNLSMNFSAACPVTSFSDSRNRAPGRRDRSGYRCTTFLSGQTWLFTWVERYHYESSVWCFWRNPWWHFQWQSQYEVQQNYYKRILHHICVGNFSTIATKIDIQVGFWNWSWVCRRLDSIMRLRVPSLSLDHRTTSSLKHAPN